MKEAYDFALQHIRVSLASEHGFVTEEQIEKIVPHYVTLTLSLKGVELDQKLLSRMVKTEINIHSPEATAMEDSTDHLAWLPDVRHKDIWRFWDRYRLWLEQQGFPPQVIQGVDRITDDILGRLESPDRPGRWDRRGLVAGQVQSGKTANYSALICKAADAGYKLIVVLAGTHNNLRAQTQHRINEAFIGVDSHSRSPIGVGLLPFKEHPNAMSLTDSTDTGDFSRRVASAAAIRPGENPLVLVIKKNATVLSTFLEWVTGLNQTVPLDGVPVIKDVPLLLIDDEADNASVNTKKEELDPTRINGLIRSILASFEKTAYIGYTATPFANLFIDDGADHELFGDDLFPRSFIVALRPPSNYMGPSEVFGMAAIPELGRPATPGLPITRTVRDYLDWIPDGHKRTLQPGPLPESLKTAIKTYVLTIAARRAREQFGHNSMLVHVTRFNDVQTLVTQQIKDYVDQIRSEIRYGGSESSVFTALETLWRSDFLTTSEQALAEMPDLDQSHLLADWQQVKGEIKPAVEQLEVRMINGLANDVLDYNSKGSSLSVIAVGGDKLSRGLTLEGLSVSYYLRASRMYDTLMQMGRWFGYRPGYGDLCRLFTTDELISWYRDIAAASEELWTEFEYMASRHSTPEDFGLRVRDHPGGLLVTAATKMRHGARRRLSYSGVLNETISFSTSGDDRLQNLKAAENLISGLDAGTPLKNHMTWSDVPYTQIIDFLEAVTPPPNARRVRPDLMARYIRSAAGHGEVTNWTILLVNNSTPEARQFGIAGTQIGCTFRSAVPVESSALHKIKRLLDPTHEALDLTDEERESALAATRDYRKTRAGNDPGPVDTPSGYAARNSRSPERGMLLMYLLEPGDDGIPYLGYGISFPASDDPRPIEYVVNNVYQQQELDYGLDD